MRPRLLITTIVLGLTLPGVGRAAAPTLELPTGTWRDVTCFQIAHACTNPTKLEISIDETNIVTWIAPTETIAFTSLPSAPCIDVDGLGSGAKVLHVAETCGTEVESAYATIAIEDLGFELIEVDVRSWELRPGMPLELTVIANATNLELVVDFSAVDPGFQRGDETVTDHGDGRFDVQYILPATSGPATGIYSLPLTLSDRVSGRSRRWNDAARVRFTPQRSPLFTVTGDRMGELLFVDPPAAAPLTPEAELVAGSLSVSDDELVPGDVTTLSGQFDLHDEELTSGTAMLYLSESGANGIVVVPVAARADACWSDPTGGTICRYEFTVDLTMRPFADELAGVPPATVAVDSELRVGVGVSRNEPLVEGSPYLGNIAFSTGPAIHWYPSGLIDQYTVRGRVFYSRKIIRPRHRDPPHAFYGTVSTWGDSTVLPDTRVEVHDGCGSVKRGHTQEDGAFELIFPSLCPHLPAEVRVRSESTRGFVRADVRDSQGELHDHGLYPAFVPAAAMVRTLPHAQIHSLPGAPYDILQQLIAVQRWSRVFLGEAFFDGAKLPMMPWAHGVYERDWCPNADGTSQYKPSTDQIQICSADGIDEPFVNRDEFDRFAILHESFHWFHDQFLVQGLGATKYSNLHTRDATEGFANIMALLMNGSPWLFERLPGSSAGQIVGGYAFKVESLDFNGHITADKQTKIPYAPWLPVDLWGKGTPPSSSGGWAGRVLWDLADPEEPTRQEPYTLFTRGPGGPPANIPDDFDTFGSFELFADAIAGYLRSTPVNPALLALDARGTDDLDIMEFLDAVVCRSHHTWDEDLQFLVFTVMDFHDYDPAMAPLECP